MRSMASSGALPRLMMRAACWTTNSSDSRVAAVSLGDILALD
jgi:hypothetical protein